MICSHCSKEIAIDKIANIRGKGLRSEIQCPSCQAWLGKNVILSWVKIIGFYGGVSLFALSYFDVEARSIAMPVAIGCILAMFISHLMDSLKVIEAPIEEEVDNSEHLQKYR